MVPLANKDKLLAVPACFRFTGLRRGILCSPYSKLVKREIKERFSVYRPTTAR